jgi:gliding motility-associated-like protein
MKTKKIILLFCIHFSSICFSQSYFQKFLYSTGMIGQIYETPDKGYFLTGSLSPYPDGYISKIDSNFNIVWSKYFQGRSLGAMVKIKNGSYFATLGNQLVKFNDQGIFTIVNTYDIKTFMGGYYSNIVQAGPNKLILGGNVFGGGNPNDWMVTVIDTMGNINWVKRYGGFSADDGGFVDALPNGEILVSGEPESNNDGTSNQNYGLIKLDSMGNYIWGKDFGTRFGEFGWMAKLTRDNYITYLGGGSDSTSGFNSPLVAKFDLNGNIVWLKKFHFNKDVLTRNFDEDNNGNLIFSGSIADTTLGPNNINKCLAFAVDKNGNPLWAKSYGDTVIGYDNSSLLSIKSDSRKNLLFGGIKSLRQTTVKYYGVLIKSDAQGNTYCKEKDYKFTGVTPNFAFDVFDSLMPVTVLTIASTLTCNQVNLVFSDYCLPPTISSSINNSTICANECAVLTSSITGGVSPYIYSWIPNIGTGPGPYTVCPNSNTLYTLTVTDKLNQSYTSISTVSVTSVTASLAINPLVGIEPLQVNLDNQSSGATNYNLYFGNSDSSSFVPNYVYNNPGTYTLTFIASNTFNCSDTLDFIITVNKKCDLTQVIPNVFTPNGDGINDILKFNTCESQNINCKIYNRWGLLISEIDRPNGFWDGHTVSGQECREGTYFYVLKITLPQSKEQTVKGFVQLFR